MSCTNLKLKWVYMLSGIVVWRRMFGQGVRLGCRKCTGAQGDFLQLMELLIDRLSTKEMELFLVQAWIIWNQRNGIMHGKQIQPPEMLIKCAQDFLAEFR